MAFDLRMGVSGGMFTFVLAMLLSHGGGQKTKAKIVFIPSPLASSPYFNCLEVAEEMVRRGHEVSIFTTNFLKIRESAVEHVEFKLPNEQIGNTVLNSVGNVSQDFGPISSIKVAMDFSQLILDSCFAMLKNNATLKKLQEADLIVTIPLSSCGHHIADILDKPTVTLHLATLSAIASLTGAPSLSSFAPLVLSSMTDEMTFLERLQNFVATQVKNIIIDYMTSLYYRELQSAYDWKSKGNFAEVFAKTEMIIVTLDIAYQYAHPLMPNTFFVGPVLAKPAKKLPADLESFMQSSGDHGVVLIAFGSLVCNMDQVTIERILTAVSRMKQKFIWKLKSTENLTIPPNLMALKWVPQNDILGHEKTKAFVSHMGINGAAEAAFHGVPIVAAPFKGERFHNAILFTKRIKMAKFIDIVNADADTWQKTIEEVIYNSSYKEHAIRTSKRMRCWPKSSTERAGDLVQYTLDNGGRLPHLKSNANSLYWFQYYCVDVVAFLVALSLLLPYIIFKVFKYSLRLLFGRKAKPKRD